jgi:hypothetical protein
MKFNLPHILNKQPKREPSLKFDLWRHTVISPLYNQQHCEHDKSYKLLGLEPYIFESVRLQGEIEKKITFTQVTDGIQSVHRHLMNPPFPYLCASYFFSKTNFLQNVWIPCQSNPSLNSCKLFHAFFFLFFFNVSDLPLSLPLSTYTNKKTCMYIVYICR